MSSPEKKLIYILNSYSAKESSHFFHVLGLLEALAARGIKIALIIEKADAIPEFNSDRIKVIALRRAAAPIRLIELFTTLCSLIGKGFTRTYIRIAAPSALVATLAHRLCGGAAFFWQSGTTIEYDTAQPVSLKKLKWYLFSFIPSTLARKLVHFFVTGPSFMVDYYARVAGVKREKIRLLYNDIDVARFAPVADRPDRKSAFLSRHGLAPDTLLLLIVHRLSPVRRTQLYFPSCLSHLRDADLLGRVAVIIAGGGPELPAIQKEVRSLGMSDRCIFLGSVPNSDIQELYALADIFLHPTYNEGFPRVVLEAMASGLPIVSTDAGGTRELLGESQSEMVVSRDDSHAFALCLEKVIASPALCRQLAQENRLHVEKFSTTRIAAMYEEVLFA